MSWYLLFVACQLSALSAFSYTFGDYGSPKTSCGQFDYFFTPDNVNVGFQILETQLIFPIMYVTATTVIAISFVYSQDEL